MFRWFESLIPVFPPIDGRMPPRTVVPFYLHYLRPVWPVLLATLVAGLLLALVEVAMFDFLGRIVDMVAEQPGAGFFQRHASDLLWMVVVCVVARPVLVGLHNLLVNQAIVPGLSCLLSDDLPVPQHEVRRGAAPHTAGALALTGQHAATGVLPSTTAS